MPALVSGAPREGDEEFCGCCLGCCRATNGRPEEKAPVEDDCDCQGGTSYEKFRSLVGDGDPAEREGRSTGRILRAIALLLRVAAVFCIAGAAVVASAGAAAAGFGTQLRCRVGAVTVDADAAIVEAESSGDGFLPIIASTLADQASIMAPPNIEADPGQGVGPAEAKAGADEEPAASATACFSSDVAASTSRKRRFKAAKP